MRARTQLKAVILMSLESSSSRREQAARQLLVCGRTMPMEETVAKIDPVDKNAVIHAASRMIASPLTVTAFGPVGQIESFATTKARLN